MKTSCLALALALPLLIPLSGVISPTAPAEPAAVAEIATPGAYGPGRFYERLFFAALEGAYRDGLSNETVDLLLERNEEGYDLLFVPGCPICMPIRNALLVYRARVKHEGFKSPFDTFGDGLPEAERKKLATGSLETKAYTFRGLVSRWIGTWVKDHRLTEEESRRFHGRIRSGLKRGMGGLHAKVPLSKVKFCPSCEGANRYVVK